MNKYQEAHGDLIELALNGHFGVIVHGCNCFCTQKSGIAKDMVEIFHTDRFPLENLDFRGSINRLGMIDAVNKYTANNEPITVINAYTQYYNSTIAPDDWVGPLVDYEALTLCMRKINHAFKGKYIGLPLIGCGRAGGDWNIVKPIIQKELKDCFVTIVKL